jgi:Isochorismatase family
MRQTIIEGQTDDASATVRTARETGRGMTSEGNPVVVVIDPYNDFISRFGKGWPLIREVANEIRLIDNLTRVLAEARKRKLPVVYAPHTRHRRDAHPQVPFRTQASISRARLGSLPRAGMVVGSAPTSRRGPANSSRPSIASQAGLRGPTSMRTCDRSARRTLVAEHVAAALAQRQNHPVEPFQPIRECRGATEYSSPLDCVR